MNRLKPLPFERMEKFAMASEASGPMVIFVISLMVKAKHIKLGTYTPFDDQIVKWIKVDNDLSALETLKVPLQII